MAAVHRGLKLKKILAGLGSLKKSDDDEEEDEERRVDGSENVRSVLPVPPMSNFVWFCGISEV